MLLHLMEKGLNRALALDTLSPNRLYKLQGKYIEITFTQPCLSTYLLFHEAGISLKTCLPESIFPDTIITGPLRAFMLLAIKQDIHCAKASGLEISGDMEIAQDFQTLFMALDMDWEEPLSAITGDVFAQGVGKMLKRFQYKSKKMTDALFQNIAEYITEESAILATDYETNEYIRAVDEVCSDLERLSANITAFKNRALN